MRHKNDMAGSIPAGAAIIFLVLIFLTVFINWGATHVVLFWLITAPVIGIVVWILIIICKDISNYGGGGGGYDGSGYGPYG